MKTKLLIICMLFCSIVSTLTTNAYALSDENWNYEIMGDYVIINRYIGTATNVVIPSHISGLPVKELAGEAFSGAFYNSKAVNVTIPDTVTTIGYMAFAKSRNLESVNVPEGITKLRATFSGCSKLKNVTLPSTLKRIEVNTFEECDLSNGINIPAGVTFIGDSAFARTNLEYIELPDSINTIEMHAFKECKNLKNIKLPRYITTIPVSVFDDCISLERIYIPKTVRTLGTAGLSGPFDGCDSLKAIVIPNSVVAVYGVGSGKNLKEISFPSSITIAYPNAVGGASINYCTANSVIMEKSKEMKKSYIVDPSVDYDIQVVCNDMRISFDTPPIIENGRTLVPLRAIFEKIGAKVQWDGENRIVTATKGNDTITLQIGSNKLYKNGNEKNIDVPAKIVDERTLVPARAVAEAFDCKVDWIDYAEIVEIQSN